MLASINISKLSISRFKNSKRWYGGQPYSSHLLPVFIQSLYSLSNALALPLVSLGTCCLLPSGVMAARYIGVETVVIPEPTPIMKRPAMRRTAVGAKAIIKAPAASTRLVARKPLRRPTCWKRGPEKRGGARGQA